MAYLLFIDESGQDRRKSPYEVLAGVAVKDTDLWNLVQAIGEAEERFFGLRYSREFQEIKARKFLNRKTFRKAGQIDTLPVDERRRLAKSCLRSPETAGRREIAGLAQAKLAFVHAALEICIKYRCVAISSIVDRDAPYPANDALRKDYAYLFERFFYVLEDDSRFTQGLVVFDELDKAQSHILLGQMRHYFRNFARGRARARQVIPEPFFVHSDLTTMIQIADLIAYVISWGFRLPSMSRPARTELSGYCDLIAELRYRTTREVGSNPRFTIWSFAYIEDLRGREERNE